jgi:pSer/pThr/pTyr-binding forkhead associated (FHA) protein
MQVCSHCGKESRAIDRYCLHCGQRLDAAAPGAAEAIPFYVAVGEGGDGWDGSPASGQAAQPARAKANGTVQATASAGTTSAGHAAAPGDGGPAMRLVLQTADGPREFALDGRECSIGRAPTCDVVLAEDQLASRRHALLRYEGGRYSIVDLGSSNGTYVNGVEIREATALAAGDRISVGEHELLYTSGPASGQAADDLARSTTLTTDGLVVPVPPPWPPAAPRATDPRITAVAPSVSKSGTQSATGTQPAAPVEQQSPAPASDIEQLRIQLVEASAALAQRLDDTGRDAAHVRASLGQLAQRAQAALAAMSPADAGEHGESAPVSAESAAARLDALIQTAKQAAENPRHLDYLTALVERSAEIARALEAQQGMISALDELHTRLEELSGTAHP